MGETRLIPILRTKLHRPAVSGDIIVRQHLFDRLEAGRNLPLTLVSASAGYGKTSLVSHWLKTGQHRYCWLSLDPSDSSLRSFLSYMTAAVRTRFPDAMTESLEQLGHQPMPPLDTLSACFINDLHGLEGELIIVLDDFHSLSGDEVIGFLDTLIARPPRGLHLVIISRRDPALQIRSLRARRQMNEFRIADLQLAADESREFLERVSDKPVSTHDAGKIFAGTEGWPVGLRLAGLAIRYSKRETYLEVFSGDTFAVQEYLLEEILAGLDPELRNRMEFASILDRFCAPLCEELLQCTDGSAGNEGSLFVQDLLRSGLPVVSLDEKDNWFRYHHLIRDLLHKQLETDNPGVLKSLHRKASRWFEQRGLIEEATHHAFAAGDEGEAVQIIIRNRQGFLEKEEWHRLIKLLDQLDDEVLQSEPELVLLLAWVANSQYHQKGMAQAVATAEKLLESLPEADIPPEPWPSEVNMFRGWISFVDGDVDKALELTRPAFDSLPPDHHWTRSMAYLVFVLYLQTKGELGEARSVIRTALEETKSASPLARGRLLISYTFLDWLTGELSSTARNAQAAIEYSQKHGLNDTFENAAGLLGASLYQLNRLEDAVQSLSQVSQKNVWSNSFAHRRAVAMHCQSLLAMGESDAALDLLDSVSRGLLESGNLEFLPVLESLRALVSARQGKTAEALKWSEGFDPSPELDGGLVYSPALTYAEVLILSGEPEHLERSRQVLEDHLEFYIEACKLNFELETRVLLAALYCNTGEETLALEQLARAIELARPGRFLRVFADRGPSIVPALNRLDLDEDGLRYIGEITAASQAAPEHVPGRNEPRAKTGHQPGSMDVLTRRELQILGLIAQHKSNKEIAEQLFIATGTVRRHTENIYQKLGVHKRQDAVVKAEGLGIL